MVKDPALVSEMVIDEDKIYCPYRETTSKNTQKITFAQKRRKIQVQILMDATKSKKDSVMLYPPFYKVGIGGEQG